MVPPEWLVIDQEFANVPELLNFPPFLLSMEPLSLLVMEPELSNFPELYM